MIVVEIEEIMSIVFVCIYVECVIGRMKIYYILDGIFLNILSLYVI